MLETLGVIPEEESVSDDVSLFNNDEVDYYYSVGPIVWVAILRNDILLTDVGEEDVPHTVIETAQSVLQVPYTNTGWSVIESSNDHYWNGIRFHEFDNNNDTTTTTAPIVWSFCVVYNTNIIRNVHVVKQFIQDQLIVSTQNLRSYDKTWRNGQYHACQFLFAPFLQQKMEDFDTMTVTKKQNTNSLDLSLCNEIIQRNKQKVISTAAKYYELCPDSAEATDHTSDDDDDEEDYCYDEDDVVNNNTNCYIGIDPHDDALHQNQQVATVSWSLSSSFEDDDDEDETEGLVPEGLQLLQEINTTEQFYVPSQTTMELLACCATTVPHEIEDLTSQQESICKDDFVQQASTHMEAQQEQVKEAEDNSLLLSSCKKEDHSSSTTEEEETGNEISECIEETSISAAVTEKVDIDDSNEEDTTPKTTQMVKLEHFPPYGDDAEKENDILCFFCRIFQPRQSALL